MFLPFSPYSTSPFPLDRFPQFCLAGLFVFIPNYPIPKIYCSAPFNHRVLATLGNAPSLIKSKQKLCYGVFFSFIHNHCYFNRNKRNLKGNKISLYFYKAEDYQFQIIIANRMVYSLFNQELAYKNCFLSHKHIGKGQQATQTLPNQTCCVLAVSRLFIAL